MTARCWHYVEVIGNSEEVRSVVCLSAQLKIPLRRGRNVEDTVPYSSKSEPCTLVGGGGPVAVPKILCSLTLTEF